VSPWIERNADEIIIAVAFGLVFFVLGGLANWFFARRERQSKTLDWDLITDEPIIADAASKIRSGLTVHWNGRAVDKPRTVSLRIINTGKKEVVAADYTKPVTIAIPGAEIHDAVVTAVSDPDLHELRSIRSSTNGQEDLPVELKPALLNEADWIELQLIVSGYEGTPDVSARFAGQSRKKMIDIRSQRRTWERFNFIGLALLTPFVAVGILAMLYPDIPLLTSIFVSISVAIGLATLLIAIFYAINIVWLWRRGRLWKLLKQMEK
jgi:hypothetical protein